MIPVKREPTPEMVAEAGEFVEGLKLEVGRPRHCPCCSEVHPKHNPTCLMKNVRGAHR